MEETPREEEVSERPGGFKRDQEVSERPDSRRWVLVGSEASRIKRSARSEGQGERGNSKVADPQLSRCSGPSPPHLDS